MYKRPKKNLTKALGDEVIITATSVSDPNVRDTAVLHLRNGQKLLVHPSSVSVFTSQQVRFRAEEVGTQDIAIKWSLDRKDVGVQYLSLVILQRWPQEKHEQQKDEEHRPKQQRWNPYKLRRVGGSVYGLR